MRPLAASSITSREMLVSWKARPRSCARRRVARSPGFTPITSAIMTLHHAGDVPAVVEGVLQRLVAPRRDVHCEAVDQLDRVALGDLASLGDAREGRVVGIACRLARQRGAGLGVVPGEPLAGGGFVGRGHAVAEFLAVDHVVAVAAPGVEHLRVRACLGVEQRRGGGEARRAPLANGFAAGLFQVDGGHAAAPRSAIISPAVALAEPITPGTPAPGCVPAPTK